MMKIVLTSEPGGKWTVTDPEGQYWTASSFNVLEETIAKCINSYAQRWQRRVENFMPKEEDDNE